MRKVTLNRPRGRSPDKFTDCEADCDEVTFKGPVCEDCLCCRGCAGAYAHTDGKPCPGCHFP
jgi:hypothetical protein